MANSVQTVSSLFPASDARGSLKAATAPDKSQPTFLQELERLRQPKQPADAKPAPRAKSTSKKDVAAKSQPTGKSRKGRAKSAGPAKPDAEPRPDAPQESAEAAAPQADESPAAQPPADDAAPAAQSDKPADATEAKTAPDGATPAAATVAALQGAPAPATPDAPKPDPNATAADDGPVQPPVVQSVSQGSQPPAADPASQDATPQPLTESPVRSGPVLPKVAALSENHPAEAPAQPVQQSRTQPASANAPAAQTAPDVAQFAAMLQEAIDGEQPVTAPSSARPDVPDPLLAAASGASPPPAHASGHSPAAAPSSPLPPEIEFGQTNLPRLVSSIRTQLLPDGGAMQIRLDPPELGALRVSVEMRDGAMTASFQTSSDEATRLLSHSLQQLKTALETQGVSVEKLQVQQAPRERFAGQDGSPGQQQSPEQNAQQEQQRRELMRRMWRRAMGRDAVDVTG